MTIIDFILAIPLAYAIYKGFKRGLILELATLAGFIIGIYVGIHFSRVAAQFISETFHYQSNWLHIIAFALVFLLVLLGTWFLGKLLEKTAEMLMLGIFNKILGAVFSLIKMTLILSFALFIINAFAPGNNIISQETAKKSILYKPVSTFAQIIVPKFKPKLGLPKEVEGLKESF